MDFSAVTLGVLANQETCWKQEGTPPFSFSTTVDLHLPIPCVVSRQERPEMQRVADRQEALLSHRRGLVCSPGHKHRGELRGGVRVNMISLNYFNKYSISTNQVISRTSRLKYPNTPDRATALRAVLRPQTPSCQLSVILFSSAPPSSLLPALCCY